MPLIDVHQHVIPDIYKSELARVGVLGSGENPWPAWSVARQLELMDELGIDAVLMSIASPGAYFGDVEFTKRLVKTCNEVMAQMVADHPGKFGAMGFVSLPDVEAACRDVEHALDVLKIDGINLQTHTGHRYLGHPEENWDDPRLQQMYVEAIKWAMGLVDADVTPLPARVSISVKQIY